MNREELNQYIDNCILLGEVVTENSDIYTIVGMFNFGQKYYLKQILDSVYIDGLYLKRDKKNKIHLVFYDGDYESLDLGDCIDYIDARAFKPYRIRLPIIGRKEYHFRERNKLSHISGKSVISVDVCAFADSYIEKVDFPNVRKICDDSFEDTIYLESASFNHLKSVPERAFYHSSLESFEGKNVLDVGKSAFQGCTKLKFVSLPKANYMEKSAFVGCTKLSRDNLIIKEECEEFLCKKLREKL